MGQMQEMHLSLSQQLHQLATIRKQMGEDIIEIQRRISVLDEAMSWGAVAADPGQAVAPGDISQPLATRVADMP